MKTENTNVADKLNNAENPLVEAVEEKHEYSETGKLRYQRFDTFSRILHLMIIVSFISLAFTGMVIKFSGIGIFQTLSRIMGGYEVTGFIHRVAAVITFLYFVLHIYYLIKKRKVSKRSLKYMLWGENSMLPQKRDLKEFIQTIKWFLGAGPRPEYGRWTYWEKFDYFAVFWGVAVIGVSGLLLWFPEFFTSLGLPGAVINVATIIHSDEALLAVGFIFTVHFFNTHFRPDRFPMDTVMFTGSLTLEELKEDRPRQYKYLKDNNMLKGALVKPPSPYFVKIAKIFGFTALTLGMLLIILIIYSMLFLYQ
jgi:cytochrome b subunit of formate dehydrogenase